MMRTSLQAAGSRRLAPRDENYPWRIAIWERYPIEGWCLVAVFEEPTEQLAHASGDEWCTEPFAGGVDAMHYYVGEVAL